MKTSTIILILVGFGMSGCSPFGGDSFINQIGRSLVPTVQTKTSTELVSGGTQELDATPDSGAPVGYKVSVSLGNQFSQSSIYTNEGGYRVYTTVQGNE